MWLNCTALLPASSWIPYDGYDYHDDDDAYAYILCMHGLKVFNANIGISFKIMMFGLCSRLILCAVPCTQPYIFIFSFSCAVRFYYVSQGFHN